MEPKVRAPVICEILGVAGVGKTSLLEQLKHQELPNIGVSFRKLAHWPLQTITISKVVPIYLKILAERKIENRPAYAEYQIRQDSKHLELQNMIYLQLGIELFSQSRFLEENHTMVFDQGPIFKLAWLHLFGSTQYSRTAMDWWQNMANAWAKYLSHCILLTASVPTLMGRVRNRDSDHPLKSLSTKDCNDFFSDYQKIYDLLMEKYFRSQDIHHVTINTELNDQAEVASKVTKIIFSDL